MNVNFESYGQYASSNYEVNALVFTDPNGNRFYFSYKTLVAFRTNRELVIQKNQWGPTTGKHLNWINENKKIRVDEEIFNKKYKELVGG